MGYRYGNRCLVCALHQRPDMFCAVPDQGRARDCRREPKPERPRLHVTCPSLHGGELMDAIHRILTGQTNHRWELVVAGVIVLCWFAMDVHQYVGWLMEAGCK